MAIATVTMREALATAYGAQATYIALFTSVPGGSAGTEVSGGGYARQAASWVAGSADGVASVTATFSIPAGATIRGFGVYTAVTGGTYLDGAAVTEQAFATAGTATLTATFTQS